MSRRKPISSERSLLPEVPEGNDTPPSEKEKSRGYKEAYLRTCIALSLIPAIGATRIKRLLRKYPHPMDLFTDSWSAIASIRNMGVAGAKAITSFNAWDRVDHYLKIAESQKVSLLTPYDDAYPGRLRHIYDPPALLWVKGNPEVLKKAFLAVVGTRKLSTAGRTHTINMTRSLVNEAGLGIISGLAHGADTLAHRICLEEKGDTVAVLGSGIDRIYPSVNLRLAYDIINQGGAVISEFLPGTKPDAHNFPVRNRIVSGISLGVLVTESGKKGGSMITVTSALDQGREVFVIPHDISNERGEGSNICIQRGWGKLVLSPSDILTELPPDIVQNKKLEASGPSGLPTGKKGLAFQKKIREPEADEKIILNTLKKEGNCHIDELSVRLKMKVSTLLSALLILEMDGFVSQSPGKTFSLQKG